MKLDTQNSKLLHLFCLVHNYTDATIKLYLRQIQIISPPRVEGLATQT